MPTKVSIHSKEPNFLDELIILDLEVPYSTISHSKTSNITTFDLHIKKDEAKALYKALTEEFKEKGDV